MNPTVLALPASGTQIQTNKQTNISQLETGELGQIREGNLE